MFRFPVQYSQAVVAAKFGTTAFVAMWLSHHWVPKDQLSVVFVALLCLTPSFVLGFKRAQEQIVGSLIGLFCALFFQEFLPISPLSVGASVAATFAVIAWLGWGPSTLVVALFSALYMALLYQGSLWSTVVLRIEAVLLGVGIATFFNWLFSRLSHRADLRDFLAKAFAVVRQRLRALEVGLAQSPQALSQALDGFGETYRALTALQDDVSSIRRDFAVYPRASYPRSGGLRPELVYFCERSLCELEVVAHHAQDVGFAALRLQHEGRRAEDVEALGLAQAYFKRAMAAFAMSEARDGVQALALLAEGRSALEAAMAQEAPAQEGERRARSGFSSRQVLLLSLVQLDAHLRALAELTIELEPSGAPEAAPVGSHP